MDSEIPKLGSGAESAHCPVQRAPDSVSVINSNKKPGMAENIKTSIPGLISSALVVLPEIFHLIPEAGCGQSPQNDRY